jgi:hypothetical protein
MLHFNSVERSRIHTAISKMMSVDRGFPHLARVPYDEAHFISKAHMAAQGLGMRGLVYTFDTKDAIGVIIHGEYGSISVQVTHDCSDTTMFVSPQYKFKDTKIEGLEAMSKTAMNLLVRCLCAGLSLEAVTQWFDSVYRLHTGRRTSPNFHPSQTFDKMCTFLEPGIRLIEGKYNGLINNDRLHSWF